MKIAAIKFAGFRGARSTVSLDFSPSFVVVVGRNGTGKSTICDAVEYALTGGLRPDSPHKEKNESILDYIWWKGSEDPTDGKFVELTLIDESGNLHRIRRTPTETVLPPGLESLLCRNPQALEHPLSELCRTAILRDEDITRLSVDLKETERFDAVRSALGTADFSSTEGRAEAVFKLVRTFRDSLSQSYAGANTRVTDLTARLSQARTEVANAVEVAAAEKLLREFLPESATGSTGLPERAERLLSAIRSRSDALIRLYGRYQEYERKLAAFRSPQREAALNQCQQEVQRLRDASVAAEGEAASLAEEIAKAQAINPRNASLALLKEHGQRLGLIDECCPLCGLKQSAEHYAEHLRVLTDIVTASSATISSLASRAAEATGRVAALKADLGRASSQLSALQREEAELSAELESLAKDAKAQGFEVSADAQPLPRLAALIESTRVQISQIESAITAVRASWMADQVTALENELRVAKDELAASEKRFTRAGKALHSASEAVDTVKRVRGEFVNEQLAQLEPLLVELYQRLRPHVDWPTVHYRLRGDVRRMLRLEVGDGLNPSFVFSSGQRRAAGLAFLLALHLSRSWCSLRTLMLDDPVQHIDDYRALHLTEVLAAIRATNRQVVCTVEDESLGKLLARRLRGDGTSGGLIVRMAYSSRDGIHVASTTSVQPMQRSVLVPVPA